MNKYSHVLCKECKKGMSIQDKDFHLNYDNGKSTKKKCCICGGILYITEARKFQLNQAIVAQTAIQFVKFQAPTTPTHKKEIVECAVNFVMCTCVYESIKYVESHIQDHLTKMSKDMVDALCKNYKIYKKK